MGQRGGTPIVLDGTEFDDAELAWVSGLADSDKQLDAPTVEITGVLRDDEADSDDFDLTDANTFKPSAMAVSIKCRVPAGGSLEIRVSGAYYDRIIVHIPGLKRTLDWWLRRPFELVGTVPGRVLLSETHRLKIVDSTPEGGPPRIRASNAGVQPAGSGRARFRLATGHRGCSESGSW